MTFFHRICFLLQKLLRLELSGSRWMDILVDKAFLLPSCHHFFANIFQESIFSKAGNQWWFPKDWIQTDLLGCSCGGWIVCWVKNFLFSNWREVACLQTVFKIGFNGETERELDGSYKLSDWPISDTSHCCQNVLVNLSWSPPSWRCYLRENFGVISTHSMLCDTSLTRETQGRSGYLQHVWLFKDL